MSFRGELLHLVFQRRHACHSFEVFGEEGWIWEAEFLGDLKNGLFGMAEQNFGLSDECAVYPFLRGGTAGLADDGAEVALGEADALCVIANLMLLAAVLVDELDEPVKDGLLA